MNTLSGKFRHRCPDWDYMEIDETCPEFMMCYCTFDDETGRQEALYYLETHCARCSRHHDKCDCEDGPY